MSPSPSTSTMNPPPLLPSLSPTQRMNMSSLTLRSLTNLLLCLTRPAQRTNMLSPRLSSLMTTTTSTTSSSFNKVKSWTSHVVKANHVTKPNSAYVGSLKSSVLSKWTTSSTLAVVWNTKLTELISNAHLQPERKKHKLDHLMTSKFLEEDEDEAVECQADWTLSQIYPIFKLRTILPKG